MEFIKLLLTSIFSAASLFAIAKLLGHKQMGQLSFFDYINGITIGSIAAEMATELEKPWKPLVAMLVYGAISVSLSLLTSKVMRARRFVNGSPCIVMKSGKLFRDNFSKAKLDLSEFMMLCRAEGYFDIREIDTAVLEYNGRLTVLPKNEHRPLTPSDISVGVKKASILAEVIMDGEILEDNLKRLGTDKNKLYKELKEQGYKDENEVLLGLCDEDKNFVFYSMDN